MTAGLGINNLAQSAHVLASKYKVLSSAVKMYQIAKKEEKKKQENPTASPDEAPNPEQINTLLETLWNYTVVDVEGTIRSVCTKVLKDSSVPFEDRVKRGEGLLMIGQIFKEKGKSAEIGLSELERTMTRGAPSPVPSDA